jgi:hypothetical protein
MKALFHQAAEFLVLTHTLKRSATQKL